MTVHFIGAGPGDPELITVRGKRLVESCPVCLYAGSLVPRAVVDCAPKGARVIDTAPMHLDQIVGEMRRVTAESWKKRGSTDASVANHLQPPRSAVACSTLAHACAGRSHERAERGGWFGRFGRFRWFGRRPRRRPRPETIAPRRMRPWDTRPRAWTGCDGLSRGPS